LYGEAQTLQTNSRPPWTDSHSLAARRDRLQRSLLQVARCCSLDAIVHGLLFHVRSLVRRELATSRRCPGTSRQGSRFFEQQIRPSLASHCLECHGDRKQEAYFRLDSREALLAGGESGPALVPGDAETSLLIGALHYKADAVQMPPDDGELLRVGEPLALLNWLGHGMESSEGKGRLTPHRDNSSFDGSKTLRACTFLSPRSKARCVCTS